MIDGPCGRIFYTWENFFRTCIFVGIMTPEDYKWHVGLVQDRYAWLNLTYEQAEQVYKFEQEKFIPGTKHFFSDWEEWDFEWTTFRQFLDPDQWAIYEKNLQETKANYEQQLIKGDEQKLPEIAYHEELFNFYETRFLPAFFEDHSTLLMTNTHFGRTKIDYIRTEYKHFLAETKKEILTLHFRYHKTFQPNQLKLSLLQHSFAYVLPNYRSFKHQMDEPTKAVAQFLKSNFRYALVNEQELLIQKEKELAAFSEPLRKKYYTDTGGWHVYSEELTEEELKEDRIMKLILLDRNKYGLQSSVCK